MFQKLALLILSVLAHQQQLLAGSSNMATAATEPNIPSFEEIELEKLKQFRIKAKQDIQDFDNLAAKTVEEFKANFDAKFVELVRNNIEEMSNSKWPNPAMLQQAKWFLNDLEKKDIQIHHVSPQYKLKNSIVMVQEPPLNILESLYVYLPRSAKECGNILSRNYYDNRIIDQVIAGSSLLEECESFGKAKYEQHIEAGQDLIDKLIVGVKKARQ
ncbi:hypothetical protein HK103_002607 [Boothiomyces macroporosus]|uniref:Uncharacterized protein n=1 Tax=Boothiomyces macroporosus TaxID=261099 RepID=A0AAD5Y097_9FUNG|nr:hypothetical protein HK103_002607 [Boothiomyces macroporosus]